MDSIKHYLFASDFDQTLSFHDSGRVLAELLGVSNFDKRSPAWRGRTWSSRAVSSRT